MLITDRIPDGIVTLQPTLVHSFQHRNPVVYVVIDLHHVVMKAMQPPASSLWPFVPDPTLLVEWRGKFLEPARKAKSGATA